jgi:putative transcriptional regulator
MLDMAIRIRLKVLIEEKAYRENRKLSYRTVAEESDIPLSVLADYTSERSKRFDKTTLEKLCKYFSCDVGDLLKYSPDDNPPKEKTARK